MSSGSSATHLSPFIAQGIHPSLSTLVNQQAGGRRGRRRGRRVGVKMVMVPIRRRRRR
jgi:hypothetical protein